MIFYNVTTSMLISAGSASIVTLKIVGGVCKHTFIKAESAGTVFKVNFTDEGDRVVRKYGFHKDEINDNQEYAMQGEYTLDIVNVSISCNFDILLRILER